MEPNWIYDSDEYSEYSVRKSLTSTPSTPACVPSIEMVVTPKKPINLYRVVYFSLCTITGLVGLLISPIVSLCALADTEEYIEYGINVFRFKAGVIERMPGDYFFTATNMVVAWFRKCFQLIRWR